MRNPAVCFRSFGGPEVLEADDRPTAAPAPDEVRVRHLAIGVNYIDTYHRSGLYPLPLPAVPGQEAAGVVEAMGEEVRGFAVGDRVAYCTSGPGAYCAVRNVAASRLLKLPEHVSVDQAAAALLKGLTVEYLIRRTFEVRAGHTVLWHAAAGGVGLLAIQWLKLLGATVIGTAGGAAKVEAVRALGCDHVIDYTHEDFVARVKEITAGAGVDVAYDSVGRTTLPGSLSCLKRRGLLVSFGNASGAPDPIDPLKLSAQGSVYLTRPKLGDYAVTPEELRSAASAFFEALAAGVRIHIHQRFPLAAAADAHRLLESRATTGSLLLVP